MQVINNYKNSAFNLSFNLILTGAIKVQNSPYVSNLLLLSLKEEKVYLSQLKICKKK